MANTARQFVTEELARGDDSALTNNPADVGDGVDVVVIHGAWLPVLWKVAKKAKTVGAKLYIRPAGSYDPVRLAYHGWKKKLVSFCEHRMLRRADVVLATCKAEEEWIRAYEPKVRKIEITDLKRFFNLPPNGEMGRLPISSPVHLLYLGRKHPLKGIGYLEEAVKGMPDVELRIVSDAKGDALERVWQWCEILVLPTLSENFGRVIAEALERGKRVITTDGAPAWGEGLELPVSSLEFRVSSLGEGGDSRVEHVERVEGDELTIRVGYGGRLLYLVGYRDGSANERVRLLKEAIESLVVSG